MNGREKPDLNKKKKRKIEEETKEGEVDLSESSWHPVQGLQRLSVCHARDSWIRGQSGHGTGVSEISDPFGKICTKFSTWLFFFYNLRRGMSLS